MAWGGYFFFQELDSTNSAALRYADAGAADHLVVRAETQTSGRGKGGRTWFSEPGSLSFTLLFHPGRTSDLQILTLACAREVSAAIDELTGLHSEVKWPNDVMAGAYKVAGILLETRWTGARAVLAIGIGINCEQTSFPVDISETARTLLQLTGSAIQTERLFRSISQRVFQLLEHYEAGDDVLADIARTCATLGRQVDILTSQGRVEGRAVRIDPHGSLVVVGEGGTETFVQEGDLQYKI